MANNNNNSNIRLKARVSAFRLLKFRLRSEDELRKRLKKKKIPDDIIEETISFLKEKRFIDDAQFAGLWADSRLRSNLGIKRISVELRQKGLNKELITQTINRIRRNYDEEKIVYALAKERWQKLKDLAPDKARQRLYGWLLRRGFAADTVIDTINKICKPIY